MDSNHTHREREKKKKKDEDNLSYWTKLTSLEKKCKYIKLKTKALSTVKAGLLRLPLIKTNSTIKIL